MVSNIQTGSYQAVASQNISQPSSNQPAPKNIGFLLEGLSSAKANPHKCPEVSEIRLLAKTNNAAEFNCIHAFDPPHLSYFLRQYPHSLHKRVCLYVIRLFAGISHIDDIIEIHLKPAFKECYYEWPWWLNDFRSNSILATAASIQKEIGGSEALQREYEFMKRAFLETSKEVSSLAFKQYLQDNPDISEVCGAVGQIHLSFLDAEGTKIQSTPDERHLIYRMGGRQVSVHLFGGEPGDPKPFDSLRRFAVERGLKLPTQDIKEETGNAAAPLVSPVIQAFGVFKQWMENQGRSAQDQQGFIEWISEVDSDPFIKTYQDFIQLIALAKTEELPVHHTPDEKTFATAVQIREAKKLSNAENDAVFYYERPRNERLTKARNIYRIWQKSLSLNHQHDEIAYVESFNMAMDLFCSMKKKRDKSPASGQSMKKPQVLDFMSAEFRSALNQIADLYCPSLLDLFPIGNGPVPASELPDLLKRYLDLIRLGQEALTKFDQREMPFFDPLGGEHACQIRAAMFAEMLNKKGIDEHVKLAIRQLYEHGEKIKTLLANLPATSRYVDSLQAFLKKHDANHDISEDILLIVSSFILSETKIIEYKPNSFGVPSRHERILAKTLSERKRLVPNFANNVIKIAQIKLSELSVIYVQRLALQQLLSREEKTASMLVFGEHVRSDERHRQLMPCYPTMRLLLKGMLRKKIPLVLRIEQFVKGQAKPYGILTMLFGNEGGGDYRLLNNASEVLQKGAVFIHAKSITDSPQHTQTIEESVLNQKVTDLILSAMADHPQYGMDDRCRPEDPQCERDRLLARQWGTCRDNPSLFTIEHIFCDIMRL